jgi:SPP1 family predicted phage head-tail adaptor
MPLAFSRERDGFAVGRLDTPVILAKRQNVPDPNSTSILEPIVGGVFVWASIEDLYRQTFYAAEQVDTPVTHRVVIRFLAWLDTTYVILRDHRLPDSSIQRDVLRIRRLMVIPRNRFLDMDCEMERRS